jgi:hypothetical protein
MERGGMKLLRARLYARIVRMRLGSDTPAYAAALAEIARLSRKPAA